MHIGAGLHMMTAQDSTATAGRLKFSKPTVSNSTFKIRDIVNPVNPINENHKFGFPPSLKILHSDVCQRVLAIYAVEDRIPRL